MAAGRSEHGWAERAVMADHDPEDNGVTDAASLQAFVNTLYGPRKPERVVETLLEERREPERQ
jgi:hypothetical protein